MANHHRKRNPWPAVLRDTLKAERCRDTGWNLHRRYHRDPAIRLDMLVPHYVPPNDSRYRWEQALAPLLPTSWCKYPPNGPRFTVESFLRDCWPGAYEQGWEEFFWEGAPFAVHLRSVGRSMLRLPLARDDALLEDFLKQFLN